MSLPESEPARPETLIPGNCYFTVSFYDTDLLLPMLDTLVYVGQDAEEDGTRLWLFKQPENPPGADEQEPSPGSSALIAFTDGELHRIVGFDRLVQQLQEIAMDHPLRTVDHFPEEPATSDDFQTLAPAIANFMNDGECIALTITIRFTDDGLSLSKDEEGYRMDFHPRPRREPDSAGRILALFAGRGVVPSVDYLSDRGRTRMLSFAIPGEPDSVVDLCRQIFAEVHSMRRGDILVYLPLKKADIVS